MHRGEKKGIIVSSTAHLTLLQSIFGIQRHTPALLSYFIGVASIYRQERLVYELLPIKGKSLRTESISFSTQQTITVETWFTCSIKSFYVY